MVSRRVGALARRRVPKQERSEETLAALLEAAERIVRAEGVAKLTRRPGVAVLTAGPGNMAFALSIAGTFANIALSNVKLKANIGARGSRSFWYWPTAWRQL